MLLAQGRFPKLLPRPQGLPHDSPLLLNPTRLLVSAVPLTLA